VQIKTKTTDGYEAIQMASAQRKHVHQPLPGTEAPGQFRFLREIESKTQSPTEIGQKLGPELFEEGDIVDVVGKSKGQGLRRAASSDTTSAVVPRRHGQSDKHRPPARSARAPRPAESARVCTWPPHGRRPCDGEELRIFESNVARGVLLIEGPVPGAQNGLVRIAKTGKKG
jgi:large subunit ribosomal protein L3